MQSFPVQALKLSVHSPFLLFFLLLINEIIMQLTIKKYLPLLSEMNDNDNLSLITLFPSKFYIFSLRLNLIRDLKFEFLMRLYSCLLYIIAIILTKQWTKLLCY